MTSIFKRELSSYFNTAIGYVVMAIFYFFAGLFFYQSMMFIQVNSLSYVFSSMFLIILLVIPIITMRSFSEEKRTKTDQLLLTSPVNLLQVVLGKFLAAFMLYALCLAVFLVFTIVLSFFAEPPLIQIACTLIGMLLYGGALIAIDVFISALTESQVVAAVAGMASGLFIYLISSLTSSIDFEWLKTILTGFSFETRYVNFTTGVINIADIFFFISVASVFLFLTVRVFEKKRWA